jgi:hypothetical protein
MASLHDEINICHAVNVRAGQYRHSVVAVAVPVYLVIIGRQFPVGPNEAAIEAARRG